MSEQIADLFIIGGGINGVGIAADAAGRGLDVVLCEQKDLGGATSCSSSKLIHGGLRYLEYYEFRLVREALRERDILMAKAPHLIRPMRFVMPHAPQLRASWLIRAGLILYDGLAGKTLLPKSQACLLQNHFAGKPLRPEFTKGFIYSDCYADDARLVIANAQLAKQKGATILTRTKFITAYLSQDLWHIEVQNLHTDTIYTYKAKILINAAGPWLEEVLHQRLHLTASHKIALIKGSHIVVPKLYEGEFAYILQNSDKRIIFVIPFEQEFSLIGTTELPYDGNLENVAITPYEIDYLLKAVNRYFNKPLTFEEIVWSYSGVRSLRKDEQDDPSAITRDYTLELNSLGQNAPFLSIFGGKITTYRKLAEHTLEMLKPFCKKIGRPWTHDATLPGGDILNSDWESFYRIFRKEYPWLPEKIAYRYARNYGTLAELILKNSRSLADLGQHFAQGLYEAELEYLVTNEWAETTEDILWRRSKLGLYFPKDAILKLNEALEAYKKKK